MRHPQKFLDENGLAPQRGFSQNFLVSSHWAERLCKPVLATESDGIWEIGPGVGALTELLVRDGGRPVTAFEIDWGLIKLLKASFSSITIIEGDVLKQDFARLLQGKNINVVSNLPYHISSPIFFKLLEIRQSIPCMVLTFQKEFADRLMASPGSKSYGAASVLAQFCFEMTSLGNLPQGAFHPVPEVVSKGIFFRKTRDQGIDYERMEALVRAAFKQRRKKMINNLRQFSKETNWDGLFEKLSLDTNTRAESLSLNDFIEIAKQLA